jgi:hypothetical protein
MTSKRERIEPHNGDKRFVRRDGEGHFNKEVNVGRSRRIAGPMQRKPLSRVKATEGM